MSTSKRSLRTAVDELRCIDLDRPPSLFDLRALAVARECLDQLLTARVHELRSGEPPTTTWAEIAAALNEPSADAARMRFSVDENEKLVSAFWNEYAERFSWDFVPGPFVHALYSRWLNDQHPDVHALPPKALTRRLVKRTLESSDWSHERARTGPLLQAAEPLLAGVEWRPSRDGRAMWGFRKIR